MEKQHIEINGIKYLLKIFIENRKNSRVSIRDTKINIRISCHLNKKQIKNQISDFISWSKKKINEKPELYKPKKQRIYNNGEILSIGDEKYYIKIDFKDKKNGPHDEFSDEYYNLIKNLSKLPHRILQNYHLAALSEIILHELGHKDCFDFKRAVYLVDNPDFDHLVGVAGFCNGECKHHKSDLWDCPDNKGNSFLVILPNKS